MTMAWTVLFFVILCSRSNNLRFKLHDKAAAPPERQFAHCALERHHVGRARLSQRAAESFQVRIDDSLGQTRPTSTGRCYDPAWLFLARAHRRPETFQP